MPRPQLRVLVGIGLVSGCALAQQVLLTRMLSAVLFYHFTFLAISLALLGTGGGGLAVYVWPGRFDRRPLEESVARWSLLFAGLLVVVPAVLVHFDYTYDNAITLTFALNFLGACVVSLLPFLAVGVAVTLAIRGYTESVSKVYAFDLVGAGVGAVTVVPVMWIISPLTGMVVLGVVSALAAGLIAWSATTWRNAAVGVAAVGGVATWLSISTNLDYLPPAYFPGVAPAADRWTPLDRVLGYAPPHGKGPFAYLFYDRVYAPVPVRLPGQPIPNWRQLMTSSESIGLTVAHHGNVLVVGGGGGRDIYDALSSGFHHVDVIELNSAIVDVVDGALGHWSGRPYVAPGVHTVVGDGRAILAERSTRYDEIHIGFTDTLSGSSADAFALSEQNLYTEEAFQEYYDHLAPGGILSVSRLYHLVGDEALRATVLTLQTLQDRGIPDPGDHVVVILGHDQFNETPGTVLSQLTPFTPAELARIRTLAAARGDRIAYAPGGPYRLEWAQLHAAPSLTAFCTHFALDVCPSTDDKPFFFNMTRLSSVFHTLPSSYVYTIDPYSLLCVTVAILLLLGLLAFLLPLAFVPRRSRPPPSSLLYFAAIGLGYLSFEITLIQRFQLFLGFPTYALSVVLCALLVFTGLGSLLSNRWSQSRRALLVSMSIGCGLIALSAYLLQPLLARLITLPFTGRVLLTVALLAPAGLTLGMAMPIGLRRLAALHPAGVPWAWGVNGITSVFAAAFGVFVAITWGFAVATLVSLGCYLVALAHAAWGRWPTAGVDPGPDAGDERASAPAAGREPSGFGAGLHDPVRT